VQLITRTRHAPNPTQQVTDVTFKAEVLDSSVPVMVDFWAPWCGPCKMIAPMVDEIAREFSGKAKVGR
jgi:thioredoxin 1